MLLKFESHCKIAAVPCCVAKHQYSCLVVRLQNWSSFHWFENPIMKQGMQSDLPPSKGQEEANMSDILAELESSESIYFQQKLTRSLSDNNVQLVLPMRFVQEHGYKIDKWAILRARTPSGTSSRPWAVQLKIYKKLDGTRDVRFVDGWGAFATHNELKEGDSLVFLLSREGARSEFEVYVFREIGGSFSLLDLCDSSSDEEDFILDSEKNNTNLSVSDSGNNILPSPGLSPHPDESAKTLTGSSSEGNKAQGLQITEHLENHCEFPSFHKRLTASSIQRSNGIPNSGQFEFPLKFVGTYGEHFQPSIQLQGVHEESPVYLVAVRRYKGRDAKQNAISRLGIKEHDWSVFVKENNLKKGQELQFSLTADSYFVVREV